MTAEEIEELSYQRCVRSAVSEPALLVVHHYKGRLMNDIVNKRSAVLRVVGIYALFGSLWIYTSDKILGWLDRATFFL